MKAISLDFNNNCICFMLDGQQGTEIVPLNKDDFLNYIPAKYHERSSFTWNFEDEIFSVNQNYVLYDGCIMTKECFVPELIMPMPGLGKKYKEFYQRLGYEETTVKDLLPPELRKLFGIE